MPKHLIFYGYYAKLIDLKTGKMLKFKASLHNNHLADDVAHLNEIIQTVTLDLYKEAPKGTATVKINLEIAYRERD